MKKFLLLLLLSSCSGLQTRLSPFNDVNIIKSFSEVRGDTRIWYNEDESYTYYFKYKTESGITDMNKIEMTISHSDRRDYPFKRDYPYTISGVYATCNNKYCYVKDDYKLNNFLHAFEVLLPALYEKIK